VQHAALAERIEHCMHGTFSSKALRSAGSWSARGTQ